MMSLPDFETKYKGKPIDFDGYYGDQCVDLINQYCVDVLGISSPISELPGATAFQIYQNYKGTKFTKIANTPDGVPQAGDIMFFNTNVGSAGHTSVFLRGDVNSFVSFDQNWNGHSYCEEVTHNYNAVAGWLRIKDMQSSGQTVAVDSTTFQELVRKSTEWDKAVAAGYASWNDVAAALASRQTTIDHLNATVADKNNTISTLQSTNTALTAQVTTLQDQLNTATEQAKKVPDLVEQLSQASFNLVQARQNNDTAQRTIARLRSQLAASKPTTFADKLRFLFS